MQGLWKGILSDYTPLTWILRVKTAEATFLSQKATRLFIKSLKFHTRLFAPIAGISAGLFSAMIEIFIDGIVTYVMHR